MIILFQLPAAILPIADMILNDLAGRCNLNLCIQLQGNYLDQQVPKASIRADLNFRKLDGGRGVNVKMDSE